MKDNPPIHLSIREAKTGDVEGIAQVHVKAWQESYKDILPKEYLEGISYGQRLELRKQILYCT